MKLEDFKKMFHTSAIEFSCGSGCCNFKWNERTSVLEILEELNKRENYMISYELLRYFVHLNDYSWSIVEHNRSVETHYLGIVNCYLNLDNAECECEVIINPNLDLDFSSIESLYEGVEELEKKASKLLGKLYYIS